MKEVERLFVFLSACLLWFPQVAWASEPPSFRYRVLPARLWTDRDVRLELTFSWVGSPEDFRFLIPAPRGTHLKFETSSESSETALVSAGTKITRIFEYRFAPERAGEASLEAFQVTALGPRGVQHSFDFPGEKIIIRSRLSRTAQAGALGGAAGLLGAAALFFFLRSRRKAAPVLATSQTVEEAALSEIGRLAREAAHLEVKEYAARLSRIATFYEERAGGRLDLKEAQRLRQAAGKLEALKFSGGRIEPEGVKAIEREIVLLIEGKRVLSPQS